jgi:hypothetical protein
MQSFDKAPEFDSNHTQNFSLKTPRPFVPTHDLYGVVHKGLRWAMFRTLEKLGRTDTEDDSAVTSSLESVSALLELLAYHLHHENVFIHSALEARRPRSSVNLEDDHAHHEEAIVRLRRLSALLAEATGEERYAQFRDLYLRFSVFIAENLSHMAEEENVSQRLLDALYTAAELKQVEAELVSSVAPDKMLRFMQIMLVAISHRQRLELLSGPKAGMPAQVFSEFLVEACLHLSEAERAALHQELE